jgi:glucose/arabinose dehydrogenase
VIIKTEWCQQFTSHSIGHLAFGPDGDLYVSGGEGASYKQADWGQFGGSLPATPTPANPCGDPPGGVGTPLTSPTARGGSLRSQSPRRPAGEPVLLNGALLRVNPKNAAGVAGNPMYSKSDKKGNASRIIAYGFRNPFRFTFRPGTSEIWVADVGENVWEEIDRVPSATVKPTPNFGWPCYEGTPVHPSFANLDVCTALYGDGAAPATPPFDAYNHASKLGVDDTCTTAGGSSVISGISFTAANSNYPAPYQGALFFGDHSRSCIWVEFPGGDGLPSRATLKTFVDDSDAPAPVDIETEPVSGDLFYVNIDSGSIHRISYAAP